MKRIERKEERIGLRLAGDDLAKAEQIMALKGCSLSEAVRLMIRGTTVRTVAVIEIVPPTQNELVMA